MENLLPNKFETLADGNVLTHDLLFSSKCNIIYVFN